MTDINDSTDNYKNQLIPKIQQSQYLDQQRDQYLVSYQPGYLNQLQFITQAKPNAVLLSIGGNDINFGDIVKRCVASFAWDPCYHKQSERRSLLITIYSKFSTLKATYRKILSEAPEGARLYVVGYPQVINPTGNCGANVHFDDSEKQFAALLVDRLNATVKAAAESSGAVYVDVSGALVGHRLCDTHDDGVNGLTNGDDGFSIGAWLGTKSYSFGLGNESYHPTVLGHQLISGAIAQQTDNLTKKSQGAASVLLPKIKDDDEFITTGVADSAQPRRIERQELVDSNIVSAGDKVTLDFDANVSNIKQNSVYQVVFHSEEVVVANGTMPESGQLHLDIVVPKLTPGIHSVHIFATDVNGEDVDVTKDLYVAASRDDIDGDGIKNADDPLPFINETDSVITPALPVEPTQKDDPRGDEDYKDQDAPSNQSAPNTAETEEDNISKQGQAATTFRLAESAQEKVLAFEQNVTPMTHSQEAVSIGAKEVLGAVALQRSKLQSNGSAKHGSLQTKPMILIGFALAVCTTGVVLAVIINKRSKKQSDRI